MERFNLETWLKDKSRKVIDDDGFPVEIIKWDANEKYPVVLLNHNGIAYNVSVDGMYDADPNHGLFFAEDEFTEFEKELEKFRTHILATSGEKYDENGECVIKNVSKTLLDLARKEIEKENPKQEWSKEDKSMYIRTLGILGKCYMGVLPTEVEEELRWFKSIEPQSQWKPSKDQMFALSMHIRENPNLESLYNDLKKL